VLEAIRRHAWEAYPRECCGALIGRAADPEGRLRTVVAALPLENVERDEPERRYRIAAAGVLAAEGAARERGLDVVGFYHSHPGAPARPSAWDRDEAWPWYAYLIVTVRRGEAGEVLAWRLADDRSAFAAEAMSVEDAT